MNMEVSAMTETEWDLISWNSYQQAGTYYKVNNGSKVSFQKTKTERLQDSI